MSTHLFHYGIIGKGRMAKHFTHYLSLLNIPYQQWHRGQSDEVLVALSKSCSPILILIDDGAIESFIEGHAFLKSQLLVHFSGKLQTPLAFGAHPLLSFAQHLYPLETYQKTPFICEDDSPPFTQLLPGLDNPHFTIPRQKRVFYHALCVLSGNFSVLLWKKLFAEFENALQIPKEQAHPFLQQITENLIKDPQKALTGPLVRNDSETIKAHLSALDGDSYQRVYKAFLEVFQEESRS